MTFAVCLLWMFFAVVQAVTSQSPSGVHPGRVCRQPLGMEDGSIADDRIQASSVNCLPSRGRLNFKPVDGVVGGWCPTWDDKETPWFQVDLGERLQVEGVIIQGRGEVGFWAEMVTAYQVQYGDDGIKWQYVTNGSSETTAQTFPGNNDTTTPVTSIFIEPIQARYIRIRPTSYSSWPSMRIELIGCKDGNMDNSCRDLMPCQNGGRCLQYSTYYECVCVNDFTGNNCQIVVDIICPADLMVLADPGTDRTDVTWQEPDITGWNGPTNFTSNLQPGDVLLIGVHTVSYQQWFTAHQLVLDCSFSVEVIGQCAPTSDGALSWLATVAGETAESFERCLLSTNNAGAPLAVRNCSIVDPPLYFQWEEPRFISCGPKNIDVTVDEVVTVPVSPGNAQEVAKFLANQTSESSEDARNIGAVSIILKNIVRANTGDPKVTESVLEVVNNVITTDSTNINAANSASIVQSVEDQVAATLQQEGSVSIQEETVHVEAVSVDPVQAKAGFSFASVQRSSSDQQLAEGSLSGTEVQTFTNASQIPEDVVASIRLPANIVHLLQPPEGNASVPLRASFILYADDTLFQSEMIRESEGGNGSLRIGGSVVSLTVEGVELVNLTEPVVIQFRAPTINKTEANRTSIKCVFWDFELNDEGGDWSEYGCKLADQSDASVSCNCSHATNFAILVSVTGQTSETTPFQQALSIISQVGCVLSIISLAIILVVYLAIRKLHQSKSRQIFIHFCISLFLLFIVFLFGIDNGRGSGGGCVFVAALLHYLVLTTMMWMAVEGRNMYVSFVTVFQGVASRYMLKACLIAWGTPLIVVAICLAAGTAHYNSEHYCFLQPDLVLYIGLLVPIGLVLLHNIITFVLVMRSLLKVKEASRSQQISKRLKNAIGISCLLGLTWVFGFLGITSEASGGDEEHPARLAFQLIFCLANSFQGVFLLVMFCFMPEEVRTAVAPYMRRFCPSCDCTRLKRGAGRRGRYDFHPVSDSVPSSPTTHNTAEIELSGSASPTVN